MQALELTTFKLSLGLAVADFIAANADVDARRLKQPGFVSRRIAEREEGRSSTPWCGPVSGTARTGTPD